MTPINFLNEIKYSKDNPEEYQIELDLKKDNNNLEVQDAYLLNSSIQIKEDLFPELYESIMEVLNTLKIDNDFRFYITPDNSSANAFCKVLPKSDRADIVFTSRIVELLEKKEMKFIIAHEIAHFYYNHYLYPRPESIENNPIQYFNIMNLSKAAEISADRLGFIAVQDIEIVLKTMIKISCGLGSQYINFAFASFLNQIEDLKKLENNPALMNSSHPSIFTRAQAVLWFSNSNEYKAIRNDEKTDFLGLKNIDELIEKSINLLIKNDRDIIYQDQIDRCLFWSIIYLALEDKHFSDEEQNYLIEKFGKNKVNNLKNFLQNNNENNLFTKLNSVLHGSSSLPQTTKSSIVNELNEFNDFFLKSENLEIIKRMGKIKGMLNL